MKPIIISIDGPAASGKGTIAKYIEKQWPELEAVIGGQISIDIAPKGRNKSQVLKHIIEKMIHC